MICEIRTYRLAPGSGAEVEKRFGETYGHRKKYSPIAAFWHTEIGPLNEIIHVWPYADLGVRAESAKDPNWPPEISEFVLTMHSDTLVPFPFSPQPTPGKMGPFYEMRTYTIKIGTLPDVRKRWEAKLPERLKLSPLAVLGHVDLGEVNRFIHIWPYASLDRREKVRDTARQTGVWPPGGGAGHLLTMENKIMMPAAFSPMQ